MGKVNGMEGNQAKYGSDNVKSLGESFLKGKNVLFLGSSVTFGAASEEDGIPEYFRKRFDCNVTKEAVSGTTLVDRDDESYVSRLKRNVDTTRDYSLVICQLSTNDATCDMPMGEISKSRNADEFDVSTITGAIEFIIAYSRENWKCPVMFYTGSRYDSDKYNAMVGRLYEIADKWDIRVLDLWNNDDFNDISEKDRALYMADPIHPTKAGYMMWWCPELERQLLDWRSK